MNYFFKIAINAAYILIIISLVIIASIPQQIEIDEVIDDRLPIEYNYIPTYKP